MPSCGGVVRVLRRVFQRLLSERPTPERCVQPRFILIFMNGRRNRVDLGLNPLLPLHRGADLPQVGPQRYRLGKADVDISRQKCPTQERPT